MTFLPSSRLLSERNFGLFWLAGLISIIGDWALRIALPIYVLRLTGSASAVSVVVLAGLVAGLAAGPVAGVCADRLDRCRVLVSVSSAQAAALAPLLIAGPVTPAWLVAAVAAAEAALAEVAEPAASALLPGLVPRRELAAANSLNSIANFVARLAGPAAGGALTAVAGVRGAAALDAATFVASAVPAGAGYPAVMTLFQLAAPDRVRGRMFAVLGVAETGANIAGAAVAGALDQHVSAVDLLTAQGAGYVLAAGLLRVLAGRGPRRLGDAVGADEVDEVRARGQRSARRGRRPDQIRSPSS